METGNFGILIKAEMNPVQVTALPGGKEIPYEYTGEEVVIHIDRLSLFGMIAIDY